MTGVSIVLAGGGSAGHTSPLIATARELADLRPDAQLTAVGTARGLENRVIPAAGLPLARIPPVPMPRRVNRDLVALPLRLGAAVRSAAGVLGDVSADAVVGFGGYVATPVYLAARRRRVPIVLHEQNALPGLANRLAARLTRHVYTSFPDTPLPHARYLGLPLRREITGLDRAAARPAARAVFGLNAELPTLLVSGGSQGARRINSAVIEARPALLAAGVQILHVLGAKNVGLDVTSIADAASGAIYRPVAFVDRMEQAYAAADLMLGRAGASTVMETAAVGLPTIFVPYPVGNGEQARNARSVVDAGGGLLLPDAECTADWLLAHVPGLVGDPGRLTRMGAAASAASRPDAARRFAEAILAVVADGHGSECGGAEHGAAESEGTVQS